MVNFGSPGALPLAEGVVLFRGASLPCSVAVVGVGSEPNVECCDALKMDHGAFAVDAYMRTSDADVFAIGDVCAFPSKYGGTSRTACSRPVADARDAPSACLLALWR